MLQKAATFLWGKQAEDGGWHSETHGILKIGQVCTPYILDALMEVPDSIYTVEEAKVRSALDFIKEHTNKEGALGFSDPDLLEYPNYATAFGLKCLFLHGDGSDNTTLSQMTDYLKDQQFGEGRGYSIDHSAYGGWGFGEEYLTPGNPGHVDISHTRRILEGLGTARALGPSPQMDLERGLESSIAEKAFTFLKRMQKHPGDPPPTEGLLASFDSTVYDGGFFYSPVQEDVNKGGWVFSPSGDNPLYLRSYATATCDGILALIALEGRLAKDGDMLVKMIDQGENWLKAHPSWAQPEGIPLDHPQQWHQVMFYYHLSVRAQAYHSLGWEAGWQSLMMDELRGKQAEDGSFANPDGAANKENDPLLATAMVVRALCAAL